MEASTVVLWIESNERLLTVLLAVSVLTFLVSLISLPFLVARIPEDYFLSERRRPSPWKTEAPLIRLLILIGKNLLGYILLAGGILMLFIPGQGVLTIAAGLVLTDYPGKFRIERKLVSQPAVFNGLNWLRKKAKKPPLMI